jgi:PAS domain S-box-containing protein
MKYVNSAALKLFRRSYDQVVGTSRKNLFPPDIAEAQGIVLKKVFETGEHVQTEEKIQFGTQELWIDTHSVPLKDKTGNVIAVLGIARDITDRKLMDSEIRSLNMSLEQRVIERTSQLNASLEDKIILIREKEILLREIHHRVRNTIQLAVSMMEIQVRRENDERVREVIHNTQNRLNAIASTFDKLYYSENMSRVNLQQVVNAIVGTLKTAYGTGKRTIQTDIHIDFAELGVDLALPLALIASELVNNSFQHAFPDGRGGMVTITGSEDGEGRITMTVSDNGSGLPVGFNPSESDTTGLTLVLILVQQIRGTLRYETSGKGTSFIITVPRDAESNKSGVSEV